MYAVVETGGKQYKVSPGEVLFVEKLPYPEGASISLEQVLMVVDDDGNIRVGQPTVEGAVVKATVTKHQKGKKVLGFKYLPRDRYRRKIGHRQMYTWLRIDSIEG
jgi:large subunit ribosomal protein L21